MISRRQLIRSGLAVSALGIGSRLPAAPVPAAPPGTRVSHLLLDARFDDAHEIARQAAMPGLEVLALPRDVLELWHDHLSPAGGHPPPVLAGVTTERGLFLLGTLAADHRLRVRFVARHEAPRGGRIAHEITGPAAQVARCRALAGPWQSSIGPALRSCPEGRPAQLRFTSLVRGAGRRDEALVSWVIGPAPRG